MKSNKNFKRTFATIALTALLTATAFSLAGCWWTIPGESIDDFWYATVEKGSDGKYIMIWGLTDDGIELSKTQTEAVIPNKISGYPVKILYAGSETLYGKTKHLSAKLGSLKKITIEPYVRIEDNFFGDNELSVVELKSEKYNKDEEYYKFEDPFGYRGGIVLIVPDNWIKIFTMTEYLRNRKSLTAVL
jgi:predicted small secreted protein